jgi:hypothetical protein
MFSEAASADTLYSMVLTRFVVLFLVASAFAQQSSSVRTSAEPTLPVIDFNACPFEGCTFGKWKVKKASTMFSTWKDARTEIAILKPGDDVTGITGVHITRKPDRILVKQAIPELSLKPGNIVLRYMYLGEGFANLWFSGAWHKQQDGTFITEKNGGGCLRDCPAIVTEEGVKEWWVKIKTTDGKVGWVLVEDNFDGMDSLG